jgi:hypothetical protein
MTPSRLDRLLTDQNGITSAQVVSCDIVNYSCRKSSSQHRIVDKFQHDIRLSLTEVSKPHADYARDNEIDFGSDIMTLATGDGIAAVFTFPGLHGLAMEFSIELLRRIHAYNSTHQCAKFLLDCWCDCHCSYNVRIGQADGKCIFYRDINGMVNVAGNAVNAAYRVMGKADPSQILVTKRSYEKLVNQPASGALEDRLVYVGEGRFKHGQNIDVWQYVDAAAAFVNSSVAADLVVSSHLETLMARMNLTSIMQAFDSMEWDKLHPDTASRLLGLVQQMLDLVNGGSEVRPERAEAPVTVFKVVRDSIQRRLRKKMGRKRHGSSRGQRLAVAALHSSAVGLRGCGSAFDGGRAR